jgi:hypothetical protein
MKRISLREAAVAFGLLFFLSTSLTFSQRLTGTLRGTVKDAAGEVLPGATVEIESPFLIGGKRSVVTTASGTFIFGALPPGTYKAAFSMPSFQGQQLGDIVISVGKTTTVDVVLKPATLQESVLVLGRTPVIDITKSGTTMTYDQKMLDNLPKARFTYIDIMFWAPGVSAEETQGEEWHSSYGSSYWSDNYLVDGVDTSFDYNGTTWVWNNPDIYQEGEVIGIGAPAEYGDFQGAVVNVITKSGGNDFHGGLSAYFIPSSFVSKNIGGVDFPPEVTQFPFHIQRSTDFSLEFSGPIKKDKIWFYSNFQSLRYSYSQLGTDPASPTKSAYDRQFFKGTIQLNKANKLVFSYQHELANLPDVITPYQPFDATAKEPNWTHVPNLMWTSILGPDTILELKLGGWFAHDEWVPMDGNLNEPMHYDMATGVYSNGIHSWDKANATKIQANASLSHFADNFIKGNHEFKMGVQYTRGTYGGISSYSGGAAYYDYAGNPYNAYFQNPYNYGSTVNKLGVFVDDAWSITNRLTLNLGLRFDHQDGDIWDVDEIDAQRNPTGRKIPGIKNVVSWNNLSPRLGLVFQLTSDKKTIFRANYGHYYEGLALRWFSRLAPSAQTIYAFTYNPDTSAYDIPLWTFNPSQGLGVDPKLKNSLCQQFSLGVTRELFADFSLEVTYLYKSTKNFLSWWNTTGQFEQVDYVDEYTGKTIKVWNQTNDPSENFLTLMNRPEYRQRYRGLIIALQKRMSHNWQLSSSFVISKAYGVAPLDRLTQGNFDGFQNPNDFINNTGWTGLLQSDRTYMFKLQGTYFFPHSFNVSLSFWAQTGKPIGRTIPVIGMNQGGFSVLAEPRGSQWKLDPWYNLDLRLDKSVKLKDRFGIKFMADIFNVFNSHTMIDTLTTIGTSAGFMKPARIVPPRRIQVAVKFLF